VIGWKDRLKILKEKKEQEKKVLEESKASVSVSALDESMEKAREIIAPTKGLERGPGGKI